MDDDVLEAGLESAFSDTSAPPAPKAEPVAEAAPAEEELPEQVPDDEPDEPAPEPVVAEPEFVIEVEGQQIAVKGVDQVKELLQKGVHYSKNSEVNARVRDALMAQSQQIAMSQQFQSLVFQDVTQLKAIDAALEQFTKFDWSQAYDQDPFKAMQLKEQRDQLREARSAKLAQLSAKEQQFTQSQAQAAQHILHSESAALAAKLPEMRNSESAAKLRTEIAQSLASYGFNPSEIAGVMDHRMVLVAADAAKYRQLQHGKDAKLKQVRDAPPVLKPGAVSDKAKVENRNFKANLREYGRKGNHRAQEALVTKALNRAFK